jgi:hypothetical protein
MKNVATTPVFDIRSDKCNIEKIGIEETHKNQRVQMCGR